MSTNPKASGFSSVDLVNDPALEYFENLETATHTEEFRGILMDNPSTAAWMSNLYVIQGLLLGVQGRHKERVNHLSHPKCLTRTIEDAYELLRIAQEGSDFDYYAGIPSPAQWRKGLSLWSYRSFTYMSGQMMYN